MCLGVSLIAERRSRNGCIRFALLDGVSETSVSEVRWVVRCRHESEEGQYGSEEVHCVRDRKERAGGSRSVDEQGRMEEKSDGRLDQCRCRMSMSKTEGSVM